MMEFMILTIEQLNNGDWVFHYKFNDKLKKEYVYHKIGFTSSAIKNAVLPEDYLMFRIRTWLVKYCMEDKTERQYITMDQVEKAKQQTKEAVEFVKARI